MLLLVVHRKRYFDSVIEKFRVLTRYDMSLVATHVHYSDLMKVVEACVAEGRWSVEGKDVAIEYELDRVMPMAS